MLILHVVVELVELRKVKSGYPHISGLSRRELMQRLRPGKPFRGKRQSGGSTPGRGLVRAADLLVGTACGQLTLPWRSFFPQLRLTCRPLLQFSAERQMKMFQLRYQRVVPRDNACKNQTLSRHCFNSITGLCDSAQAAVLDQPLWRSSERLNAACAETKGSDCLVA